MANPPPRPTYPITEWIRDEKYLGKSEYWIRSGLTKQRYMISSKGRVKGPRGHIGCARQGEGVEARNRQGNSQFFRLARLICEAFTTFEYDPKKHRFCWLDGDSQNRTLSNLGVQMMTGDHRRRLERAKDAGSAHIIRIKIEGEDAMIERRAHITRVVLPNIVKKENLTDIWLVSHGMVDDTHRWTYSARRKTDGEQDR